VLQCVAVCSRVLQCVAACCSVLQRVAVCCSVLQRGAQKMKNLQNTPVKNKSTLVSFTCISLCLHVHVSLHVNRSLLQVFFQINRSLLTHVYDLRSGS